MPDRLCVATRPCEHIPRADGTDVWVSHCKPLRGVHLDDCDDGRCRGCMPRLAEPGLQVCRACELRVSDRLGELPRIYDDLLTPTRVAGGGKRGQGQERPLTLADEPRAAREAVERLLASWLAEVPRDVTRARPAAVEGQARAVLAFLPRLLADEHLAEQLVHDVDVAYEEGRRRAYPSAPQGNLIGNCPIRTPTGACGGLVRATIDTLDESGWATCGTCKTGGVIAWWLETMPREEREFMGMKELRWHLLIRCGRQIAESTIRSWADAEDGSGQPVLSSACEVSTQRRVFRAEDARGLAEMYRRRGRPRSVAS
jgi:hypothetical protein